MKPFLLSLSLLLTVPAWAQTKLTVRVLDPKNAPVAGANIAAQLWQPANQTIVPQATGPDGTAKFEIPPGADGKPTIGNFCVVAPGFAFTNWSIDAKNPDIHLKPGVTWHGHVVDEAGKPIEDAEVRVVGVLTESKDEEGFFYPLELFGEKNRAAYATKTGLGGDFKIADLPAGTQLRFTALHSNYAVKNGNGLSPDAEATIKLAPGGALRGRVLNVDGKPLEGVAVGIYSMQLGAGGNTGSTDANGFYSVKSLAAGAYKIRASVGREDKNPDFLFPRVTGVRVEAGKTLDAPEVRAITGVVIQGLARDAVTQKPLPDASVIAQAGEETDAYSTSDATGQFQLRVVPGSYRVYISGPPEGYTRPDAQKSVDAGAVAPTQVVFDLKKARILRGTMVDEAGKPLQGKVRFGFRSSIESDSKGHWQYQPREENTLQLVGGDVEDGYFEVISPLTIAAKTEQPTTIVLRKLPWQVLPGRALTTEGQPIEGVRIEGQFHLSMGDGSGILDTSQRRAISNANGDFVLPRIRDGIRTNFFEVSGKKEGFAFQKGGQLSKNGPVWQVSDFIFAPLNFKITGTTAPGARVTVAGLETLASADGAFEFQGLPATTERVWAYKDGSFGGGVVKAPLQIELKAQAAQPREPDLARDIWNDIVLESQRGTRGRAYDSLPWIQMHLAVNEPNFSEQLAAATDDTSILTVSQRLAGKADPQTLEAAISRIKSGDLRVYALLSAAAKAGDKAMSQRALQAAEASFETAEERSFTRENNLYLTAALTTQELSEQAGIVALERALAYTLKNHPETSVVKDATEVTTGRNDALARQAEVVAMGGPVLLQHLLQNIEPGTGHEAAVLMSAIPILAKSGGVQSALPLLDELEKMPEPPQQGAMHRVDQSPQWAFAVAAIKIVPLLAESPQQGLQLALRVKNGVYNDGHRAQALAEAARFQSAADAAKLWREILREATAAQAPRYAARAFELDPQLGRELFEVARQKVADESKNDWQGRRLWAGYGFYLARADAAQARYVIEREWGAARQKKTTGEELGTLSLAMAAIDGLRAWQMAQEIPADNFSSSFEARRKIGIYLSATEESRRDFPFYRNDNYEEWRAIEEQ